MFVNKIVFKKEGFFEFEYDVLLRGVNQITGYNDVVWGQGVEKYFYKEFSFALDGVSWGDWIPLTNQNLQLINIPVKNDFRIKFKYKRLGSDSTPYLRIESLVLQTTILSSYLQILDFYDSPFEQVSFVDNYWNKVWVNLLEKCYSQGAILPDFILRNIGEERDFDDSDYILFWKVLSYIFALPIASAEYNITDLFQDRDKLFHYLEQRGLYLCGNETKEQLDRIQTLFYSEMIKRGTRETIRDIGETNEKNIVYLNDLMIVGLLHFENTGNTKAIEIFNGTKSEVDLSDYLLFVDDNGLGNFSRIFEFPKKKMKRGDTIVIGNNDSYFQVYDKINIQTFPDNFNFNDSDQIQFWNKKDNQLIEHIGMPGVSWGSDIWYRKDSLITSSNNSPHNPFSDSEWVKIPITTPLSTNDFSSLGDFKQEFQKLDSLNINLGEIKRLICYNQECDEFFMYVTNTTEVGNSQIIDMSSINDIPSFMSPYFIQKFPTIDMGSTDYQSGWDLVSTNISFQPNGDQYLEIQAGGFIETEDLIKVDPNLDYLLSIDFLIDSNEANQISIEIFGYDKNFSPVSLLSIEYPYTNQNKLLDYTTFNNSLTPTPRDFSINGLLASFGSEPRPNQPEHYEIDGYNNSRHLRLSSDVRFVSIRFENHNDEMMTLKKFSFFPKCLPSDSYVDSPFLKSFILKNNNPEKTNYQIEEIIRRYFVGMDEFVFFKWIDKDVIQPPSICSISNPDLSIACSNSGLTISNIGDIFEDDSDVLEFSIDNGDSWNIINSGDIIPFDDFSVYFKLELTPCTSSSVGQVVIGIEPTFIGNNVIGSPNVELSYGSTYPASVPVAIGWSNSVSTFFLSLVGGVQIIASIDSIIGEINYSANIWWSGGNYLDSCDGLQVSEEIVPAVYLPLRLKRTVEYSECQTQTIEYLVKVTNQINPCSGLIIERI